MTFSLEDFLIAHIENWGCEVRPSDTHIDMISILKIKQRDVPIDLCVRVLWEHNIVGAFVDIRTIKKRQMKFMEDSNDPDFFDKLDEWLSKVEKYMIDGEWDLDPIYYTPSNLFYIPEHFDFNAET